MDEEDKNTMEELRLRLIANDDDTLTSIGVGDSNNHTEIGKAGVKILELAEALKCNTTLIEVKILAEALRYNTTVTEVHWPYHHITLGSGGGRQLAESLTYNRTIMKLNLMYNDLGDDGACTIATILFRNMTLKHLSLIANDIGDQGAMALADSLRVNAGLTHLYLGQNMIRNEGASALASSLKFNGTIRKLNLNGNRCIRGDITYEIDVLIQWNRMGALAHDSFFSLPPVCQNHVLVILLSLKQLSIADDLHWHIMSLLKVRDVVDVVGSDPIEAVWPLPLIL